MNKFTGFTEEDFEIFDEPNLDKRKEKIEREIIPKLKNLAREIKERKPQWENFYQHCPKIRLWKKHLPTTCFLAFTREEGKKYLPYAQLNVGLCKKDGVRIRLGFSIGKSEEYDIHEFIKYIEKNKSAVKKRINRNSLTCFFSKKVKNVPKNGEQTYERQYDVELEEALCELKNGQHRWEWFEIGKQYDKSNEIVKSSKLVDEAIRIFESLYCVYNDINGMK